MRPCTRLDRKEYEAGRIAVEPVHRRQVLQSGVSLQAHQQRPLNMVAGRRDRHSVRLVYDHDLVVTVNNQWLLKREWLRRNLFPIESRQTVTVGRILSQHHTIAQSDLALRHTLPPNARVY